MPEYAGMTSIDYTGARFVLGRAADGYAIWEMLAGGQPSEVFPATQEGWAAAWLRFRELEGEAVPVPAGAAVPDGTIRPFGLGGVLAGTFQVWGRSFLAFVVVVATVMIPFGLLQVLVMQAVIGPELEPLFSGLVEPAELDSYRQVIEENLPTFIAAAIGLGVASLFLQGFLTAALIRGGLRGFMGGRAGAGEMLGEGLRRIFSLAWILFLTFLLVAGAGIPIVFVLVGLGVVTGSEPLTAVLIILAVLAILLFATRYLFAPEALIAENVRGSAALRRSWHLTMGRTWAIFGIFLLLIVMVAVAGGILSIPFQLMIGEQESLSSAWMLSALTGALTSTLTTPFMSLALVHLYIDARARKEALHPAALDPGSDAPAP